MTLRGGVFPEAMLPPREARRRGACFMAVMVRDGVCFGSEFKLFASRVVVCGRWARRGIPKLRARFLSGMSQAVRR